MSILRIALSNDEAYEIFTGYIQALPLPSLLEDKSKDIEAYEIFMGYVQALPSPSLHENKSKDIAGLRASGSRVDITITKDTNDIKVLAKGLPEMPRLKYIPVDLPKLLSYNLNIMNLSRTDRIESKDRVSRGAYAETIFDRLLSNTTQREPQNINYADVQWRLSMVKGSYTLDTHQVFIDNKDNTGILETYREDTRIFSVEMSFHKGEWVKHGIEQRWFVMRNSLDDRTTRDNLKPILFYYWIYGQQVTEEQYQQEIIRLMEPFLLPDINRIVSSMTLPK